MKGKDKDAPPTLTLGSKYHVRSLASREAVLETRAIFRGVVSIGTIDALALEIAEGDLKGTMRVIPSHVVLAIDILEAAKKEDELKEDASMHYT